MPIKLTFRRPSRADPALETLRAFVRTLAKLQGPRRPDAAGGAR